MSKAPMKPTLESLAEEVRKLKERLEDLEDLIELRAAVSRNAGKPGTLWEEVKEELTIDTASSIRDARVEDSPPR